MFGNNDWTDSFPRPKPRPFPKPETRSCFPPLFHKFH